MNNGKLEKFRAERSGVVLTLLFALQPCLDALAYWTRNDRVTPAGLIRLGIMILLNQELCLKEIPPGPQASNKNKGL